MYFADVSLRYNSTVDAAKKRRTNVSDFRLSIGGSKRKSAFASNFAAGKLLLPLLLLTVKSNAILASLKQDNCGDILCLLCCSRGVLSFQLLVMWQSLKIHLKHNSSDDYWK